MSKLKHKILVFDDGTIEVLEYNKPAPLLDKLHIEGKYCTLRDGTPCTCGEMMDEFMVEDLI
jgi:hypothetical protein